MSVGLVRAIAEEDPGAFAGLERLWTGGDVVPPEAVARVLAACPGLEMFNGYGPTETTVYSTAHLVVAGRGVPGGRCRSGGRWPAPGLYRAG